MKNVALNVDGRSFVESAHLDESLLAFLSNSGLGAVPEVLEDDSGVKVVPAYTLAHSVNGKRLVSIPELKLSAEVPALTDETLLSATTY